MSNVKTFRKLCYFCSQWRLNHSIKVVLSVFNNGVHSVNFHFFHIVLSLQYIAAVTFATQTSKAPASIGLASYSGISIFRQSFHFRSRHTIEVEIGCSREVLRCCWLECYSSSWCNVIRVSTVNFCEHYILCSIIHSYV